MSGDHNESGERRKVLGLGWDKSRDELYVDVKVNISPKKKGLRAEPDLELGEIEQLLPATITKRTVWRIFLGQYDILGLVCVFLIRLKLIMRELSSEDGRKVEWDEPVPPEVRERFAGVLACMHEMKTSSFPAVWCRMDPTQMWIRICSVLRTAPPLRSAVWFMAGGSW